MTRSFPYLPNSGMKDATGSVSRMRPSSTSAITAGVVATTFVSDARSKIVSSVMRLDRWLDRPVPVRTAEHDCVAASDDHYRAGCLFGGDGFVDDGVEAIQPSEIEAGAHTRAGFGQPCSRRLRLRCAERRGCDERDSGNEKPKVKPAVGHHFTAARASTSSARPGASASLQMPRSCA